MSDLIAEYRLEVHECEDAYYEAVLTPVTPDGRLSTGRGATALAAMVAALMDSRVPIVHDVV